MAKRTRKTPAPEITELQTSAEPEPTVIDTVEPRIVEAKIVEGSTKVLGLPSALQDAVEATVDGSDDDRVAMSLGQAMQHPMWDYVAVSQNEDGSLIIEVPFKITCHVAPQGDIPEEEAIENAIVDFMAEVHYTSMELSEVLRHKMDNQDILKRD